MSNFLVRDDSLIILLTAPKLFTGRNPRTMAAKSTSLPQNQIYIYNIYNTLCKSDSERYFLVIIPDGLHSPVLSSDQGAAIRPPGCRRPSPDAGNLANLTRFGRHRS